MDLCMYVCVCVCVFVCARVHVFYITPPIFQTSTSPRLQLSFKLCFFSDLNCFSNFYFTKALLFPCLPQTLLWSKSMLSPRALLSLKTPLHRSRANDGLLMLHRE